MESYWMYHHHVALRASYFCDRLIFQSKSCNFQVMNSKMVNTPHAEVSFLVLLATANNQRLYFKVCKNINGKFIILTTDSQRKLQKCLKTKKVILKHTDLKTSQGFKFNVSSSYLWSKINVRFSWLWKLQLAGKWILYWRSGFLLFCVTL